MKRAARNRSSKFFLTDRREVCIISFIHFSVLPWQSDEAEIADIMKSYDRKFYYDDILKRVQVYMRAEALIRWDFLH